MKQVLLHNLLHRPKLDKERLKCPSSFNNVRIRRQTQVSWLQGHYFSSITSSFLLCSKTALRLKAARETQEREGSQLTLTDTCIDCHLLWMSQEFFLACKFFYLTMFSYNLRDESYLSHPNLKILSLWYFPLNFYSQVCIKVTESSQSFQKWPPLHVSNIINSPQRMKGA